MNNKNRIHNHFLEDMLESMNKISQYLLDTPDFETFSEDSKTIDAIIRNFEIIGEASKNLPMEFKQAHEDVPWQKMYVLRNILSHEYFGIDLKIIWEIATQELIKNQKQIEQILKNHLSNDQPI